MHCRTASQLSVDNLLSRLKLPGAHLSFLCPVACKLGQIITAPVEIKHRRSIRRKINRFLFLMHDFTPCLDDIFFRICHIMQRNFYRICIITQHDIGLRSPFHLFHRR